MAVLLPEPPSPAPDLSRLQVQGKGWMRQAFDPFTETTVFYEHSHYDETTREHHVLVWFPPPAKGFHWEAMTMSHSELEKQFNID
jgi:hypothetical protein